MEESINPDIIATLHFRTTEEGGRESALPLDRFGCIFTFEDENFDCFLLQQDNTPIKPGNTVQLPMKFLYPQFIKHKLSIGDNFTLREVRVIAEGQVEDILGKLEQTTEP